MMLPAFDRDMSSASDEQLLKVVGLIDTLDRRGPVDRLLEPVRDRLALLRPARPLTLGRVLILPFEDVLVPAHEAWAGRPCFPRPQLAELIARVTAGLPAATAAALRARAAGHSMMSAEIVLEIGAALWPAAAAMVAALAADQAQAPELSRQLATVAPLLALGPVLVPSMWELPPRPMGRCRDRRWICCWSRCAWPCRWARRRCCRCSSSTWCAPSRPGHPGAAAAGGVRAVGARSGGAAGPAGPPADRRYARIRGAARRIGQPTRRRCSPPPGGRPGGARRALAGQPIGPECPGGHSQNGVGLRRPRHRDGGPRRDPGPVRDAWRILAASATMASSGSRRRRATPAASASPAPGSGWRRPRIRC